MSFADAGSGGALTDGSGGRPSPASTPRPSPEYPSCVRRAISRSPSTRAGWPGGRPAMSRAIRLRICSAKCGVDAPMSWRTSSRVTSWPALRRMGCSSSDIDSLGLRSLLLSSDAADLEEIVDLRLDAGRDRLVVPDEPAVIVDTAHRVLAVPRLDVEQVRVERRVELVRVGDHEQRAVRAARRERRGGGRVERAVRAGEHHAVPGVDDAPAER